MKFDPAIERWRRILGDRGVLLGEAAQQIYSPCTTSVKRRIIAALLPKTVEDIVAIVTVARDSSVPLYPISTGHNWGYGTANPVADGSVIVDLSGLKRILDMDPDLGLVTIEPGVTQQQLCDYLAAANLPFLVPVTGAGPNCSLVGNALERGYGITPYADHFAAVTNLEAVLPNGEIYRSALSEMGGQTVARAFKWGLGPYLDGLFAQGNLGIVTQMTIGLARRPERIEAFFFGIKEDAGLENVVLALREALGALSGITSSINLMNSHRVLAMIEPYPYSSLGTEGVLAPKVISELATRNQVMAWSGVGALYGKARVVKAARQVIKDTLKSSTRRMIFFTADLTCRLKKLVSLVPSVRTSRAARIVNALDSSMQLIAGRPSTVALRLAYWKSGHKPALAEAMDPARDGCGLIWYTPLVPMKPDKVRVYVDMVKEICISHGMEPLITMTSLSERCFDSSVPLLFDPKDEKQAERAQSCYQALFEAGKIEGFIPYRMGVDSMMFITESTTPFWNTVSSIKNCIDPEGIIAPGRYSPRR